MGEAGWGGETLKWCEGHDHWFHCSSVPDGHKYTSLQSSLKSCSKLWAKADAQLKRRWYALLHFRVSPPHSASPSPPSPAGVIRGAYTGAVQAFLTFSICKLLTFSGVKCSMSLYFAQTLLRNAKLGRGYQNHRNFALNTSGAIKLRRFCSPDLASLKCYAFLRPSSRRAAAPWGVGGKGRITFQTTT